MVIVVDDEIEVGALLSCNVAFVVPPLDADVGVTDVQESALETPNCMADELLFDGGKCLPELEISLAFDAVSSRSLFPLSSFFNASAASSDFLCIPSWIIRKKWNKQFISLSVDLISTVAVSV